MTRIYRHRFTVPPESIDMLKHVNNIEYLRWMQDVAIAHSTDLGWPMERYFKERCSWVIRSHFIEYLRSAVLHDPITLLTWVAGVGERSSTRKYLFWRESDRQVLARAETAWVFIDLKSGLPMPILDSVRASFPVVEEDGEAAEIDALLGSS
ncbi:thioesterase family protein [Uliginosibacterium sp. TH139]|uniref:acyl-CoA thioesterase n=1 Tax=Uliginosibacterium sp. TH139 TaxID=2067453 RepID=UPI000C7A8003|nr:acyl-CoA thioesterase [Uliginosibacterium sp. TH139]PLK50595.1 thioesterase [Uliginosibacterium sp. TH139]